MAVAQNGPDLHGVPVQALRPTTRNIISILLNPLKVLPTDDGLPRDWRGLAQLVGLQGNSIPMVGANPDPTAQVLTQWVHSSVGLLQEYLGQLDRWDIVDDTAQMMEKDGIEYKKLEDSASTSAPALDVELDKQILTKDDLLRLDKGLEPQCYSAYLLYANEDEDFAMQIVEEMETNYHLKLCLRDRDLVGGHMFQHEAIMKLISERCNRLIVVVSPNFLMSEANKFFVTFAYALGIDQKHRKVVPVMYKTCTLPPELSYYFLLDYTRAGHLWNFWQKLHDSIQTPSSYSRVRVKNGLVQPVAKETCSLTAPVRRNVKTLSVQLEENEFRKSRSLRNISEKPPTVVQTKVENLSSAPLKKSKSVSLENLKAMSLGLFHGYLYKRRSKKKGNKTAEACQI